MTRIMLQAFLIYIFSSNFIYSQPTNPESIRKETHKYKNDKCYAQILISRAMSIEAIVVLNSKGKSIARLDKKEMSKVKAIVNKSKISENISAIIPPWNNLLQFELSDGRKISAELLDIDRLRIRGEGERQNDSVYLSKVGSELILEGDDDQILYRWMEIVLGPSQKQSRAIVRPEF